MPTIKRGIKVFGLKDSPMQDINGRTTGTVNKCKQEGCTGRIFHVKWPDGKVIKTCERALELQPDGSYRVIYPIVHY